MMVTSSTLRTRERWTKRYNEYLASHPNCIICGSTNRTVVRWTGPPELKERISLIFRHPVEQMNRQLVHCATFCAKHAPPSNNRVITEHGSGVRGVKDCDCNLCVERAREYNRELQRNRVKRIKARAEAARALGLDYSRDDPNFNTNTWHRTPEGKRRKRETREQIRTRWARNKSCAVCGSTENRLVPQWPGENQGTRASNVWTYGEPMRSQLLKTSQAWCYSCVRRAGARKGRERKHNG